MIKITKLNDKSVVIDRGDIVKSFTEPFFACCEDDNTRVVKIYNSQETYNGMPENITVNGVSGFTTPEEAIAAIAECFASFKSAGSTGSGSGAETDPIAMAKLATYFDSNGQLKASALPSTSSVPIELLPVKPITPALDTMYVFPNSTGTYQMQFWDGVEWNVVGDFGTDFIISDYPTNDDLTATLANYASITALNSKRDATTSQMVVYTTDSNGGQNTIPYATQATANTIPVRSTNGSIAVGSNVSGNNAVGALQVQSMIDSAGSNYQATLTAGDNITIDSNNVISSTGGSGSGIIEETDPVAMPVLTSHMQTDVNRWNDAYLQNENIIISLAAVKGLKPDGSNGINLLQYDSQANYYTVPQGNGGIIMVMFYNIVVGDLSNVGYLYINTQLKYSSEGIIEGGVITKVYEVKPGDTIYSTGLSFLMYDPYISIPSPCIELDHQVVDTEYQTQVNTPIDINTGEQLVTADELAAHSQRDLTSIAAAHNDSLTQIANLQSQILNLQASISNKTINGQTAVDILSLSESSYTFTNDLGGRLVGQGVRTIGLLGIVLLSTGVVSVNGVEVYNNTSLIGVGDAAILNMDINSGDVITSSGMGYLTVTNYVAG